MAELTHIRETVREVRRGRKGGRLLRAGATSCSPAAKPAPSADPVRRGEPRTSPKPQ